MPTVEKVSRSDSGLASSLRVSVARLHRRLRTEDVDDLGVSVGGVAVLALLYREGDCSIGQLASSERVQPPSMTRTVTCLEGEGYVERCAHPTDGRQVVVRLSDKGRGLLAAERRRRDAWLTRRMRELTAEERAVLRQAAPILEKLSNAGGQRLSPTFRALAHRNYRLYYTGGFVSNIGTWMQRVAQDWLVLLLSNNSGTALGITTGLQFLPILLLSPYAGAIADRFPKKRLLQIAQLMMAAPAVLLGFLAITGLVEQWHVYAMALAFGVATAFEAPVRQSFISELVTPDDLQNAVSLNSASFNGGRIIGPGLAGLMIAALGSGVEATGVVILLNAVSYGAVLIALSCIRGGLPERDGPPPARKGMVTDGLRYVRSRPDLLLVLGVMFFVGTFGLNFQLTSALMATEVYGKGAGEYGVIGSIMALGSITGALLSARRTTTSLRLVLVSAVVFGSVEIFIATMPTYLTFVLLTPLIGITALTTITSANTLMQLSVPAELRGRVMALYLMVFMGGTPLGSPLVGWVGETFGARWSLIGGGLVSILGTLLCAALYVRARGRREAAAEAEQELPMPRLVG